MMDGGRLSIFRVDHWVQKPGHLCSRPFQWSDSILFDRKFVVSIFHGRPDLLLALMNWFITASINTALHIARTTCVISWEFVPSCI
jgi:hypothetical protein